PVHHEQRRGYSHSTVWLIFPTKSLTFEVKGRAQADALLAKIAAAREAISTAVLHGDFRDLKVFDIFAEARARDFERTHEAGPLAREMPAWLRIRRAIAALTVLLGIVPGVGLWCARNALSDLRAYSLLNAAPDVDGARTYVGAGGRH